MSQLLASGKEGIGGLLPDVMIVGCTKEEMGVTDGPSHGALSDVKTR
jgi:hypothetical protein